MSDGHVRPADALAETVVPARFTRDFALSALVCAGAGCVVLIGLVLTPDARGFGTHEQTGLPPCPMPALTGYPCPTCGFTTAVSRAAHLDFPGALAAHPFGTLVFVAACAVLVRGAFSVARGGPDRRVTRCVRSLGFWLAVFTLYLASWAVKLAAVATGLQSMR
jgi:hypothetical protein